MAARTADMDCLSNCHGHSRSLILVVTLLRNCTPTAASFPGFLPEYNPFCVHLGVHLGMPVGPCDDEERRRVPAGTTPTLRVVACELRFLLARGVQRSWCRIIVVHARADSRRMRGAQRRRAVWLADRACMDGLILSDGRDWGESGVRAGCTAVWNTAGGGMLILGMGHDFRGVVASGVISVPMGLEDGRRGKEGLAYDGETCEFSGTWVAIPRLLWSQDGRGALEVRGTEMQLPGDADDEIQEDNA
ncbi:hypothetical protein DFH09DRAFT_1090380 [Mycena vulgaris]|nr:hypothetical protein DFH09DRAFT_1090380 [Mycena vulgaris]